jgi:hypothetical protein
MRVFLADGEERARRNTEFSFFDAPLQFSVPVSVPVWILVLVEFLSP